MPLSYATWPPELICLACMLPDTANKFFSLPFYFEICQNGTWKWNVSMELAMHFDLKRYSGLWTGCGHGTRWVALSEIISMLEMDQRHSFTHVGGNHLSRDILPFDVLICLPSPHRSFWRRFPGIGSGFVFLLKYTSLDVSFHWGNISTSHFTNDKLLGYRLYSPHPLSLYLGNKAILWWDALWWSHIVYLGRTQGARKNTE